MSDENIIVGSGTKWPLNGILSLPGESFSAPFPALVLVHGSGPQDMNEKVLGATPFKDIAETLSASGIAVLRYNKRTYTYRKEIKKEMRHNFVLSVKEETIEDAVLAGALLKSDPRINKEKIFILGHSLGAMLAPRIDADGGDFAGMILMAGSLRRLEYITMDQIEWIIAGLNPLLRRIAAKQMKGLAAKIANLPSMTEEESKNHKMLGSPAYYFKEMAAHPTGDYLAKTDKPILILQGEADFQMNMSDDFGGYQRLLENKQNVTFKSYPNLTHLFTPSVYGKLRKYKKEYKIPVRVDESVRNDIANWVLSHSTMV
jgi:dienelactone hydrolase